MFLMPDGTPFFGGTYFPKTPRYGMPGFKDLLPKIAAAYHDKRDDIRKQNAALLEALGHTLPAAGHGQKEMGRAPLSAAVRELAQAFDDVHGGIGRAPKFPHPFELEFCLRRHARDGGETALAIARLTLAKMAEGGIYDQLGGGFCRYSTDQYWAIPHFEKMLYDNGPLIALYSDAWRVTRQPLFKQVVAETAAWVMREMQSPDGGGYYSSLDADSEHEEGKFYVWTPDEVRALLTEGEFAVIAPHFGLDGAPNFDGRYWHLVVTKPLAAVAGKLDIPLGECATRLASAREKMLAVREKRIWPGRDEKVLASWNALMIKGMARAARVFGERVWLESAQRATDFIRGVMWRDGRLLATYKDGRAHLNAYLDDHAFLLDALTELMQAGFRMDDLEFARDLAELLLAQFEDREHGGFFFVSHDHEKLIHRAKPGHDNATPSGNGVAAIALQRLGHILCEPRYLAAAERAIRLFYPALEQNPSGFVSLATALEEWLTPPRLVILRGQVGEIRQWQHALAATYRPDTLVIGVPDGVGNLPPALDKPAGPRQAGAAVNAWLCRGVTCLPPTADRAALEHALDDMDPASGI